MGLLTDCQPSLKTIAGKREELEGRRAGALVDGFWGLQFFVLMIFKQAGICISNLKLLVWTHFFFELAFFFIHYTFNVSYADSTSTINYYLNKIGVKIEYTSQIMKQIII